MGLGISRDKTTIVILEDDPLIIDEIHELLTDEGYCVFLAKSIQEFKKTIRKNSIDLCLVDVNLPDGNGLNIVKDIRKASEVGIIIMSGKKIEEIDRVVGLEIGSDDYITKPYSPRELLARISSVLRRTKGQQYIQNHEHAFNNELVQFLNWSVNLNARYLTSPEGEEIHMTTAEFELLHAFIENPQRVLSRDFLLDRVHGRDCSVFDRSIDGLVSRVRRKVPLGSEHPPIIKTIRNVGYMFTPTITKDY